MNYFLNRAKELEQELIAMRRELHSYAELGFDLPKTNAFVTEKLRSYGYEPKTVGKAGVTCTVGEKSSCCGQIWTPCPCPRNPGCLMPPRMATVTPAATTVIPPCF